MTHASHCLQGKTVLITGASSGIGAATAKAFAKAGAELILLARRQDRMKRLSEALVQVYGTNATLWAFDIRETDKLKSAIEAYSAKQAIDILVNNAGLAIGRDKFQDSDAVGIDIMVEVNLKALLHCTHAVLPAMLQRNQGHIINIGSVAGHETYAGGSVYAATKHAVRAFNASLKKDLHGSNIRVSSIDPGMVETEFSLVRFAGDADQARRVYQGMCPLTAEDIADCILFAASRPAHVNLSEIKLYPTDQSAAEMVKRSQ